MEKKVVGRPFQPGQSGNPSGRPKDLHGIKALCQTHAPLAIQRAVDILNDNKAKYTDWIEAGKLILDRAYGKPIQEVKGVQSDNQTRAWLSAIGRLADVSSSGRVNLRSKKAR